MKQAENSIWTRFKKRISWTKPTTLGRKKKRAYTGPETDSKKQDYSEGSGCVWQLDKEA